MHFLFLLFAVLGLASAIISEYPEFNSALTPPVPIDNTPDFDTGGHAGNPVSIPSRWPRDSANMVTIYWCFRDADAEQNIGVSMDRAWETWTRKLGLASQANRHALQVKRWITPNTNLYPYCYDGGNNWDPTIPPETVVVKWTPLMQGGQAWTGYIANDNTPGRHILERGNGPPGVDNDWVQAHELGHVLGLHHEHQRLDRNNYIRYNPENVVGYEDAVCRAAADGVTVGELVNLEEVGRRYN